MKTRQAIHKEGVMDWKGIPIGSVCSFLWGGSRGSLGYREGVYYNVERLEEELLVGLVKGLSKY